MRIPRGLRSFCHNGSTECGPDDPKRLVWVGPCFYWTDNWALVEPPPGPFPAPRCPHCGALGVQIAWGEFLSAAKEHEADGRPGYVEWVLRSKETCLPQLFQGVRAVEA